MNLGTPARRIPYRNRHRDALATIVGPLRERLATKAPLPDEDEIRKRLHPGQTVDNPLTVAQYLTEWPATKAELPAAAPHGLTSSIPQGGVLNDRQDVLLLSVEGDGLRTGLHDASTAQCRLGSS